MFWVFKENFSCAKNEGNGSILVRESMLFNSSLNLFIKFWNYTCLKALKVGKSDGFGFLMVKDNSYYALYWVGRLDIFGH